MNSMPTKKPNEEYNSYNIISNYYYWKWLKNKVLSYYDYIQIILNDILNLIDDSVII